MKRQIKKAINKLKLNKIDPFFLDISISNSFRVSEWLGQGEPSDSAIYYFVFIDLLTDEEGTNRERIGEARCYFHSGYNWANEEFVNLLEVADSFDGEFLAGVEPVTDEHGMLQDEYARLGILYIAKFYIKPEYRGKGIGQVVFPLIIDILGRESGVITIIPTPMEDNGHDRIKSDDPRYKLKLKQMIEFIEDFGFVEVDRDNRVWAKDPTLKD